MGADQHGGALRRLLMRRRGPWSLAIAGGVALLMAAVFGGGPRTGYLPGAVVAPAAMIIVDSRLRLRPAHRWAMSAVVVLYLAGGLFITGDDIVLARWSLGPEALRYDHLLHVAAGAAVVLAISDGWTTVPSSRWGFAAALAIAALGSGMAVEAVEWLNAALVPGVFSYGYADSGADMAANVVGICPVAVLAARLRCSGRDAARDGLASPGAVQGAPSQDLPLRPAEVPDRRQRSAGEGGDCWTIAGRRGIG